MDYSAKLACGIGYTKRGDRVVIFRGSHLAAGVHDVVLVHEVEGGA